MRPAATEVWTCSSWAQTAPGAAARAATKAPAHSVARRMFVVKGILEDPKTGAAAPAARPVDCSVAGPVGVGPAAATSGDFRYTDRFSRSSVR